MAAFRCLQANIANERFSSDGLSSLTSEEQEKVEASVKPFYDVFKNKIDIDPEVPTLYRNRHVSFLKKGLVCLPDSYECLDASRPWLCYWILHSLELLSEPIPDDLASSIAQFLGKCQCPGGGFGGGPGQQAHLAPTYAAVHTLCIIGTEESYSIINREMLQRFIWEMRSPTGAFHMHHGGEVDIRGAYCAISVARLSNISCEGLFDLTPEWIVSCQTYEGGFAGVPGMEAHGGYSFCGYAALVLLHKEMLCDDQALLRWTVNRQMRYEGGFQGRTNKLVDGCYSFWQGAVLPLLHNVLAFKDDQALSTERWMFHQGALQEYLLICCQHILGGLIDKPGKIRDYYHSCYCLSGLSVSQHFISNSAGNTYILGNSSNLLETTHPAYNIGVEKVALAIRHFSTLSVPKLKKT